MELVLMVFYIGIIGTGLAISVVRIMISKKGSSSKSKIRVSNLSSRIIKNKKYQNSISERVKPTFK